MILSGLKKFINCSVYQSIPLEYFQQQIIACPQFQRLHHLKQLGNSFYIYPSATNTRFAHSVGVGYLAGKFYDHILSKQPELRLTATEIDRKLVVSAGMMHDLGHGPNSHAFEAWVRHAYPDMKFSHEKMSCKMLQAAYDQGHLPFLNEKSPETIHEAETENKHALAQKRIAIIGEIIMGREKVEKSLIEPAKQWMLDIVSNPMIDVDRLDYLLRDTQVVFGALPTQVDYEKIFQMARVLNGRICYHTSVAENITLVLQHRLMMYKQVYLHETCLAVELMQRELLDQLDKKINIHEMLSDAEKYLLLDDSILRCFESRKIEISQRIQHLDLYDSILSRPWSTEKPLPTKNQLFASIENTDLKQSLDFNDLFIYRESSF